MSVMAVKSYLAARHRASLDEIAVHLRSSPDAVRGFLELWLGKGKVRRVIGDGGLPGGCANGCCRCGKAAPEVFEWVDGP